MENGARLFYNPSFGFGIMNGNKMVDLAMKWKNVPEAHVCDISSSLLESEDLKGGQGDVLSLDIKVHDKCSVKYLEHVQVTVTIAHPKRGNLEVILRSPNGTITKLLSSRPRDNSRKGFHNWTFMSVQTWGEQPQGKWTVYVADRQKKDTETPEEEKYAWTVSQCKLTLRGINKKHQNHKLLVSDHSV
eukprot:TRINITY_DN9692_c0_g1_i1.p1 TRINITY_DN9692_c0_g1~~TRINITY_DN9692_c0_g1_i1.p1  ORF type:complete len:188 (+),score=20.35 TRINITY_DN9692_c0_g1_i1:649-1212(+)